MSDENQAKHEPPPSQPPSRARYLEPLFFGAPDHAHPGHPTHDHWDRHAWIVLGTDTIFLWHMVMGWMQGHNYEAVLEVDLARSVVDEILEDRERFGNTHILGNRGNPHLQKSGAEDGHTVPDIVAGHVPSFVADIWNYIPTEPADMSWPYSKGSAMKSDVEVRVRRVVHYRHVNLNITGQRFENYLLFGSGKEAHLCHTLVDQPDYDHAATLRKVPDWIDGKKLESGIMVSVPTLPWSPDRTRCINPLRDGERYEVLYHGIERYRPMPPPPGGEIGPNTPVQAFEIEMDRSWWFSTRVVNYPPENPCGALGEIPEPRPNPPPSEPPRHPGGGEGHDHG